MLTNEQKSAAVLMLASIDENLSLSTFAVPTLNNSKVYFINSKDGKVNLSAKDDNLESLSKDFGKVINYVLEYSDIDIDEEDSAYEIIAKILNSYIEWDYITEENLQNLGDLRELANKTTNESKILEIASSLLELAFVSNEEIILSGEDIEDDLAATNGIYNHDNEEYLLSIGADWINLDKVTNAKLVKTDLERIKYMLMAAISGDMHLEIAGNDKLENVRDCFLYGVNKNGLPHEFYLHNRTSSEVDTQILREKVYNTILDGLNVENKSDAEKDKLVIELLQEDTNKRFTPKQFRGNLSYLEDMVMATLDTNMGRERLLMEAFTITLATLIFDMNLPITKIPRGNQITHAKYSINYFEQVIQANYELLKRDKTLFQSFLDFYNDVMGARKLTLAKLERGERLNLTNLDMLSDNLLPLKNAVKDLVREEKFVQGTDDLRDPEYIKQKLMWLAEIKKKIKSPNTTQSEYEEIANQINAFLKEETLKAEALGMSRKDVIKLFDLEELFFPKEETISKTNNKYTPKRRNILDDVRELDKNLNSITELQNKLNILEDLWKKANDPATTIEEHQAIKMQLLKMLSEEMTKAAADGLNPNDLLKLLNLDDSDIPEYDDDILDDNFDDDWDINPDDFDDNPELF